MNWLRRKYENGFIAGVVFGFKQGQKIGRSEGLREGSRLREEEILTLLKYWTESTADYEAVESAIKAGARR